MRAPDAAWITEERWKHLRAEHEEGFIRGWPDFLIEVRSPSERLGELRKKMAQWIGNGARLAWLVDPGPRHVEVWRPDRETEIHDAPLELSAEMVCPGLVTDFRRAWECLPLAKRA